MCCVCVHLMSAHCPGLKPTLRCICLTQEPGCSGAEVSSPGSCLYTFSSSSIGHTFTTRALIGPSQVTWGNAQSFLEEPATPRLPGGPLWQKKSPLSPSILKSCHINNFLHWDVHCLTRGSQLGNVKHQEGERSVHLFRFVFAAKPSRKMNAP